LDKLKFGELKSCFYLMQIEQKQIVLFVPFTHASHFYAIQTIIQKIKRSQDQISQGRTFLQKFSQDETDLKMERFWLITKN
jgi:hypothetical protein